MLDTAEGSCPLCHDRLEPPVYRLHDLPTLDGAVADTVDEAMSLPIGDVSISLCGHCGWIGNATFEASRLSYEKYHFSLQHSPVFEAFVADLVDRLADRYKLEGGKVLDVGCGAGDFLRTFARRVTIQGQGVDPSVMPGTEKLDRGTVTFERGLLEPRHAELGADLVCCRHVLNSMPDPIDLLRDIRAWGSDKPNAAFYFEVPHANRTFDDDIVWNLAYEHRSWFNEASFRVLCERSGFEVCEIGPCWRDEYLGAELRRAPPKPDSVAPAAEIARLRDNLERFAGNVESYASHWSRKLAEMHGAGRRVAIWGAGARAQLFLRQIDDRGHVGSVVDINPVRHGKYLVQVGTRIDPPASLREFQPDLILISNASFADEIREQAMNLGLSADFELF